MTWIAAVAHPARSPGAIILDVESRRITRPDISRHRYDATEFAEKLSVGASGSLLHLGSDFLFIRLVAHTKEVITVVLGDNEVILFSNLIDRCSSFQRLSEASGVLASWDSI